MATLKHIASKNSDYTAIEAYLVYQHDAFTGKQLLDEQGKPKLRDSYLLDTLECGDFSFATACLLANRKYGKNTQHGDIKSHQYIISFDPRDASDNGLTMEKAQALGLKFCEENFPGHPAIVCTHPDGHNHSGNIHVHIVIGSIRTREVERKPYMQRPRDWREGMKHSSTAQTMRHLRVEVMELCEGAGLYQIDLLNGSKERVSEREYWMKRRGQLKLDRENAALLAAGQQPTQTKFETAKEILRKQISNVLDVATSFEDFSDRLLQQYGITVKESRGRLSYLPAGRTKFIRAKHLGDKFDKAEVLATLTANAARKPKVQSKTTNLAKLIDIQAKLTEGKGIGYERWAKKFNLKAMSQTLILLQEKDLLNEDDLNQRIAELENKYHDSLAVVKDLEGRMKTNKELRYHIAAYTSTKNVAQQLKTAKRPAAFEEQHRAELTAYRAAAAYFKANNLTKLPSPKKLEAEYEQLASEKAKFYEQYKEAKEELLKLKTAKQNVALFFREDERTQHHER
ncbi:relaxase/mobilization nuclease domain-containing protein [Faecalibacterium sp. 4P15]|uniref:relaxase/mobilization nuclease domain-containing protein n=1 Tax=Faecalibacterium duncaniae (strain DSM 17677 / JCM 31915 / A2-165) TaxID=411483 RepID=UPI00164AD1FC|nr:relaxase/mobilization nuclease domain-containing protein [Faecalibacterium duncaniae]MBC5721134.1 relaxase/mobilization nuclease domain-containing protein [Faecalibacterium duncaniae]